MIHEPFVNHSFELIKKIYRLFTKETKTFQKILKKADFFSCKTKFF